MLSPQLHTQTHLGRVAVAEPWATTLLQLLTRSMFRKQALSASQVLPASQAAAANCSSCFDTEAIAHKRHVLPSVTLALYDLPEFASFDLMPYATIMLSDLPADAVMGEPARLQLLCPCIYRTPQRVTMYCLLLLIGQFCS